MSKFFVVSTPIGNLDDISTRGLETLKEVDLILAEDTRVTQKIASKFDIDTKIKRYNEHNPEKTFEYLESLLKEGKNIALVSDSGTPSISDPGFKIVDFVISNLPETEIRAVPGPSAVITALSVSGIPANEFTFLGFPPSKNKRKQFFERIKDVSSRPVVLYESPHRLQKTFKELQEVIGDSQVFVAKEMTKIYEDYFRGQLSDAESYFSDKKGKGEFVIIIP